jgi:hypothetical protein
MRAGVRRLVAAFRAYAAAQGWTPSDYRLFIETNHQWGRIHAILVARSFPGETIDEHWNSVVDFLDEELKDDPNLRESLNLVLRTFDELEEGGIYRISSGYVEVDELPETAARP